MSETDTTSQTSSFKSELLKGKKGIVFGVANKRSIAWAISRVLANHGAQLAFAYQGDRLKESVAELAQTLPGRSPLYQCDVTKPEEVKKVFEELGREFGSIQFLVHAIAFAKKKTWMAVRSIRRGMVSSSP